MAKPVASIVFFLASLYAIQAFGQQDPNAEWMMREIIDDTLHHDPYVSQWFPPASVLHWPADMGYPYASNTGSYDPIVRIGNDLFYVVENTGRVYQLNKKGEGLSFKRMDETVYSGYNFGAYTFQYHDTIWSFGGYGFWQQNAHLRFFSKGANGWEIMPVNRKVFHMYHPNNNFLDIEKGVLYVITGAIVEDGIKKRSLYTRDTISIMTLDLKTKNWSEAGIANSELEPDLFPPPAPFRLPWGKFGIMGPKHEFKTYCYDFRNNEILMLKDRSLASRIFDGLFPSRNSQQYPYRTIHYHFNDTLHIINSNRQHIRIRVTRDDFASTGLQIYRPREKPFLTLTDWAWLGLCSGLLALTAGVYLTVRGNRMVKSLQSEGEFNAQERELLQAMLTAGTEYLSTEAVDAILQPQGKSIDSIKKKRSSVLRSVNEKYSELTGDPEPLIVNIRMNNDRRMMRYGIAPEKEAKLRKLVG